VEKAVIGRGKYELRDQYKGWLISETKWFSMTKNQREKYLTKFSNASLSDTYDDANSINVGRDISLGAGLSIQIATFCNDVRVPKTCLEGIWNKAAELLKMNDAIVTAPGGNGMFVLSYSSATPHHVTPKNGTVFACDTNCPNWK
jgi:hypothetical protein